MAQYIWSSEREILQPKYSNQQGSYSDLMEKQKFLFFPDKQRLEFSTTIQALQQILK